MTTVSSIGAAEREGRQRLDEALEFVKVSTGPSHAWCTHPDQAWTIANALGSLDARSLAEQAWAGIEEDLSTCPSCLIAYHQAQVTGTYAGKLVLSLFSARPRFSCSHLRTWRWKFVSATTAMRCKVLNSGRPLTSKLQSVSSVYRNNTLERAQRSCCHS